MATIKAPLVLGFQITGKCTLNCTYCYAHKAPSTSVSWIDAQRIAKDLISLGVFSISIEGGEPLLYPNWYELSEIFLNGGLEVAVLTNGTICNTSILKKLLSLAQKFDLFTIQISLDSENWIINDKTRGRGKEVLQNLTIMVEMGIEPVVATVVHSQNIGSVINMIDSLQNKIRKFHFMNIMPVSSGLERIYHLCPDRNELRSFWIELESYSKKNPHLSISTPYNIVNKDLGNGSLQCKGCTAGTKRATISPDLKLLPCGLCPDWVLGDLSISSFEEIWASERAEIIRNLDQPPCKIKELIW